MSYVSSDRYGMRGLGDSGLAGVYEECRGPVTLSLNAVFLGKPIVYFEFPAPFGRKRGIRREGGQTPGQRDWSNIAGRLMDWASNLSQVTPDSTWRERFLLKMDANAFNVPFAVRVFPYDPLRSDDFPITNDLTTLLATLVTELREKKAREEYIRGVRVKVSNLFHSIFAGMKTIPADDVEWGTDQVVNQGKDLNWLSIHWTDHASRFAQILVAVPWYTDQDDMYGVWKSKAWDVQVAITAIVAAHPKGGNGGGAGKKKESATTNLDFLKSPWVWVAAAAAGGFYYWTQVKNKSMGQLPYVGKYLKGR